MSKQAYSMDDFLNACAEGHNKAIVLRGAMYTAKADFNLKTQERILDFIGSKGLEKPCFLNSKPWGNNPDKTKIIQVDAWEFFSGKLFGYIAFFFQPKTKKWNIKSFKKNSNSDPRNFALEDGLKKLFDKKIGDKT